MEDRLVGESEGLSFVMQKLTPYMLLLITDYSLTAGPDGTKKIVVHVPPKKERHYIQDYASLKANWGSKGLIWVSGGGAYIINHEWVPLVKRSADSPTNPGRLTVSTGRAETDQELEQPCLLIRELFEEIVIFNSRRNSLLIPSFKGTGAWSGLDITKIIAGVVKNIHHAFTGLESVDACLKPEYHQDQLIVHVGGDVCSAHRTHCHVNKTNGEVNLLYAVHLDIPCSMDDLVLLDTECHEQNGRVVPLRREVYLYHLPSRQFYLSANKHGTPCSPETLELTPHAKALLHLIHGLGAKV
ncbi:MAG: hypothetical protein HQM16_02560 [Deltaproteobacteria bacterium]|nr:hypothetical protein [Deltaproteobacteria bacterium]